MADICLRAIKHGAGRSHRDTLAPPRPANTWENRGTACPVISLFSLGDSLLDPRLLSSFGLPPL